MVADEDADVRTSAVNALAEIGPAAKDAVPAVVRALKDSEPGVRRAAVAALAKVGAGDDAAAALLDALKDKDGDVAVAAGKMLQNGRKLTKEQVPLLADVAKNGPPAARRFAVGVLVGLGAESPDAVTVIGRSLTDQDKGVRLEAVRGLGKLGASAWRVAPELGKVARGPNKEVQKAAVLSLGKIGPKAIAAVPDLIALLHNEDLHDDAARTLVKIGKASVSALVDALDGVKDFKMRVEIINLLGEIGPDAEEAIEPLKAIINDTSSSVVPGVRTAATKALQKIEKKKGK